MAEGWATEGSGTAAAPTPSGGPLSDRSWEEEEEEEEEEEASIPEGQPGDIHSRLVIGELR